MTTKRTQFPRKRREPDTSTQHQDSKATTSRPNTQTDNQQASAPEKHYPLFIVVLNGPRVVVCLPHHARCFPARRVMPGDRGNVEMWSASRLLGRRVLILPLTNQLHREPKYVCIAE